MKTDARVKYTKMVLKKALLELMQHKPVNKISIITTARSRLRSLVNFFIQNSSLRNF